MTTLKQARDALAEIEATVVEWEAKQATATAQADQLEGDAGVRVLRDPASAETIEGEISGLHTAAKVAGRAAEAGRQQVEVARRELLRAAAEGVRSRAKAQRRKANDREGEVAQLLEQLAQIDGRRYAPVCEYREAISGLTRREFGPSGADEMRSEAARLEELATELDQAAGRPQVTDAMCEPLLARAVPGGKEATEREARAAEAREQLDAQQERTRQRLAVREAWINERTRQLRVQHRWSEDRSRSAATAEFREASRKHGSSTAAVKALEGSGGEADDAADVEAALSV